MMAQVPTFSIKVETGVALDWHEWTEGTEGNPPPPYKLLLFGVLYLDGIDWSQVGVGYFHSGENRVRGGVRIPGDHMKKQEGFTYGRVFWTRFNLPEVEE